MLLSQILMPQAVRLISQVDSKKRLLQEISEVITVYNKKFIPTLVFDALMSRETLGATGVGNGVALPHARIKGLDKVAGAFFKLEKPMDFSSVDRQPVDLIFALFAPAFVVSKQPPIPSAAVSFAEGTRKTPPDPRTGRSRGWGRIESLIDVFEGT